MVLEICSASGQVQAHMQCGTCPGCREAVEHLEGLELLLQEAAQPHSVAPAVHSPHAVAAKAQHGRLPQLHGGPLRAQGLRTASPLSQNPDNGVLRSG